MKSGIQIIAVLAAGVLGVAAAAHAQMPSEPPASGSSVPRGIINPSPGPDDARIARPPRRTDAEFVDMAKLAGKSEIQASRLALEKSSSPDVRAFAKRMVDDHRKANERLQQLAARNGVSMHAGRIVDPDVEALRDRSGRDFDVAYVAMVGPDAHRNAIRLFEDEARDGRDSDLRAFAAATLPSLRHHLTMAQALARKVGAR
ncbi:DUF4142 domain-containing protein [Burkholderia sp. BCC1977]|uniref:DUF4142 domain-containing protein n=1 Tax=Burkholderia sp. BCC1977 TaxID=2817440 RepID=UPI002ABD20BF|nr:DUF4142 domain-containing protein [Burkholderia sp. BCC1977]